MALTLALPLFGLDIEHFSALRVRLLGEENVRNLPGSGRNSPSAGSESSGISSLTMSGESVAAEVISVSSRPETPIEVPCRRQEKENTLGERCRVIYGGRDILNIEAHFRELHWHIGKSKKFPEHDFTNHQFSINYPHHKLNGRKINMDYSMKRCKDCEFYETIPYFY